MLVALSVLKFAVFGLLLLLFVIQLRPWVFDELWVLRVDVCTFGYALLVCRVFVA